MDSEVHAMSTLSDALEPLDVDARERVLQWAMGKYKLTPKTPHKPKAAAPASTGADANTPHEGEHETIAELFAAVDAPNGHTRALVAGYWLQVVQNRPDFTSFEVNKELKNLGHGSKRINSDFDALMVQKPQLAVQLKKSGKSQQARQRYKITQAGINRVRELLGSDSE